MHLRTQKRYTRRSQPRPGMGCLRRILRWVVLVSLIVVAAGIYQNRSMFAPGVSAVVSDVLNNVGDGIGQINAPPPTATPDSSGDLQRALAAWNRGSIQEAVGIYQRIAEFAPNNIIVHYQLAFGLIMEGRFEEALQAAEDTITADPFSPHGWTIRAMALNRLGRYGEAAASAIHAQSLIPEDGKTTEWAAAQARAMAFQAEAYLNLELGDRASTIVDRALEINPRSAEAYQVRGQINQLINFDFDAARADYAEAYTLSPNLVYLGIWLARMDSLSYFANYSEALELYTKLIESNPDNTQVLLDLGTYYYRVDNNFSRAQEIFSRCVEANPEYQPCYYMLGRSQYELEQLSLAVEPLETAVRMDPDDAYAMWWLARTYRYLGECPDAIPLLQQGRQIAVQQEIASLVENYDYLYGECGLVAPQAEVTPEVESTEEASADA
jgi:tetratricopeptide (TPR) repeat protein